jgi:hypothetical protein
MNTEMKIRRQASFQHLSKYFSRRQPERCDWACEAKKAYDLGRDYLAVK